MLLPCRSHPVLSGGGLASIDAAGLGDICYSPSGISQNSYNESMSITDNGQLLGFRALMGHSTSQLLTNEGMAEHFWGLCISPLKQSY